MSDSEQEYRLQHDERHPRDNEAAAWAAIHSARLARQHREADGMECMARERGGEQR